MIEHPIKQPINHVIIDDDGEITFTVGHVGVSRIEACTKSGMHADIPYIRVWKGDHCIGEFCQHHIVGVYFGKSDAGHPVGANLHE